MILYILDTVKGRNFDKSWNIKSVRESPTENNINKCLYGKEESIIRLRDKERMIRKISGIIGGLIISVNVSPVQIIFELLNLPRFF